MHKVLLIMIDACRPDALLQAHTPALDQLWQRGAYTWRANAVWPSLTLPCHMSLFRGVPPQQHGVLTNTAVPNAYAYPSVIDVAHEAGLHTAAFHSWEELRDLAAPGSLHLSYYRKYNYSNHETDAIVAETACNYIVQENPDFTFVYFAKPDLIGHQYGWMSEPYIASIEDTDRIIAALLNPIEQANRLDDLTILVLADHGGHDHDHGDNNPEDMTIPWLICGPGIKAGYQVQSPVTIMDTAAIIAHRLGLPCPPIWEGKAIAELWLAP